MGVSPGGELKELMERGPVILPGVYNGLLARLVKDKGFKALYISGAGLANSAGMPDVGLLTMTETVTKVRYITGSVDLPSIVDGDTGFGEPLNVMRLVEELEIARVAGVHLEDQVLPKKCGHLPGKSLIAPAAMAEKITAAVEARQDPDFLVIARTDARENEGLDGAVKRALLYKEAGADVIFPEALESKGEFAAFAQKVGGSLLANMTEFGKTPYLTSEEFGEIGYRLIIFPLTLMRLMLKSAAEGLDVLKKEKTQINLINRMVTRREVYDLLDYDHEQFHQKRGGKRDG